MKKFFLVVFILMLAVAPAAAQSFDNAINLKGYNDAMDITSNVVAPYVGTITALSSASTVEVTSTSAQDGVGGTGCITLTMSGISSTGAALTETITMDGETAVVSVNSYLRIDKLVGLTYGDTDAICVGTITASLSGTTFCTIAAGGTESFDNIISYPAAAATVSVVSTSTSDTSAGTGIRTIQIDGLDANWASQNETITLDGTTAAVSTKSFIRINAVTGMTFGTAAGAVGQIKVYSGYKTYAVIPIGKMESEAAMYSVPASTWAYIKGWKVSAVSNPAKFTLCVRPYGSVFNVVDRSNILSVMGEREFDYTLTVSPKSDIVIKAAATTGTAPVTAHMFLNHTNNRD